VEVVPVKLGRRVKKAVNRAVPHPVKAGKKKVRATARKASPTRIVKKKVNTRVRAVKRQASPKRAVKARVKKATNQKVVCSVCGRTVNGVLRHGRWQVGPHNRPTSHISCSGVVVNGHKRVRVKGAKR
jgi:hypothetical protein